MAVEINNFTVIESIYGRFIVNRHCTFQAEALIKTGKPHIDAEIEILLGIVATLPDGAFVVDAGANIGLISIPLAKALLPRGGAVLAFEVQRLMFYALAGAAALNDLENLFVYPHGLGGGQGSMMISRLDYGADQDFGTFSLKHQGGHRPENITITTVDNLGLPRLDLLKIDVEGMETDVLLGGRATIGKNRPWIWVEYWKIGAEPIKALLPPDYQSFVMDELNLLCAPTERLAASGIVIEAPRA